MAEFYGFFKLLEDGLPFWKEYRLPRIRDELLQKFNVLSDADRLLYSRILVEGQPGFRRGVLEKHDSPTVDNIFAVLERMSKSIRLGEHEEMCSITKLGASSSVSDVGRDDSARIITGLDHFFARLSPLGVAATEFQNHQGAPNGSLSDHNTASHHSNNDVVLELRDGLLSSPKPLRARALSKLLDSIKGDHNLFKDTTLLKEVLDFIKGDPDLFKDFIQGNPILFKNFIQGNPILLKEVLDFIKGDPDLFKDFIQGNSTLLKEAPDFIQGDTKLSKILLDFILAKQEAARDYNTFFNIIITLSSGTVVNLILKSTGNDSQSLLSGTTESAAAFSAVVGLYSGLWGHYIIANKPNKFLGCDPEVSLQNLGIVGGIATGLGFMLGVLLLLPNNLFRWITMALACGTFLMLVLLKLFRKL